MLDIGSWEFLIVIAVALIVIGPKDLPALVRNVSMWIRRAKDLAREFQSGLEDMARETEIDKMTDEIKADLDPDGLMGSVKEGFEHVLDPDGEVRRATEMDPADWGAGGEYDSDAADTIEAEEYSIADPAEAEARNEDQAVAEAEAADKPAAEDDAKQAGPGA